MKNCLYYITISLLVVACASKKDTLISTDETLSSLQRMMTGSYTSAEQASKDSSYYDITLHMYPIWKNDMSVKWLYVEQAVTSNPSAPYRQRIYKLEALPDGHIASYVYTLDHPEEYIGKWQEPQFFNGKNKSILSLREGCEVILLPTKRGYEGSTRATSCGSTLRGASYATSKVTIEDDRIESWDQGYDAKGVQVWGATKGPYIFKKY